MTTERRLAQIERALNPTELVLAWLDEAHGFDDFDGYLRWLLDQPASAFPANRLAHQAVEGTRASLRGRPREMVDTAVRKALRETLFRLALVMEINVVADEAIERHQLIGTLLAFRFSMLLGERSDVPESGAAEADRQLALCCDLMIGEAELLAALDAARTEVKRRYLGGHPALFPAVARAWVERRKDAASLHDLATRLIGLADWSEPAPATEDEMAARAQRHIADLVEPARVQALEMLDEGERALALAVRWLRPKLALAAATEPRSTGDEGLSR